MEGTTSSNISTNASSLNDSVNNAEVIEGFLEVPSNSDGVELHLEELGVPDQDLHEDNIEIIGEPHTEEKNERISQFPMSRIKQIMKMDPEVTLASQDAVFAISKSTELFVRTLVKEAHYYTAQFNRKTIQKKDVESAISNTDSLLFLDGALDV